MDSTFEASGLNRVGDRKVLLALTAITLLGLGVALWVTRGSNPLRSDSPSYLYLDPSRTIGYPAFLSLIRLVTGRVAFAVPAQMVLLGASLLALGWSFHRFSGRPTLALAFQVLLIGSPEMWKISALIMTEALATACVAAWCAQLLRMIRAPSLGGMGLLVAIASVGTTVRPPLIALLVATAVFVATLAPRIKAGRALAMIGTGVVGALAATPLALYFVNGSTIATSPLARGILQHTFFCSASVASGDPDETFVEQSAAPARRYVASAPADIVPVLKRIYSGELRFGLIIPALGERHKILSEWQTDPIIARVARERVEANPWCYGESVMAADYRMATYATSGSPGESARIRAFIDAHPPVRVPTAPLLADDRRDSLRAAGEFGEPAPYPIPPAEPFRLNDKNTLVVVIAARILYAGAALIGLLSLSALPFRARIASGLRTVIAGAGAAGVAFHGIIAITAIVELGLTRYTVPVWPIACLLVAIASSVLLDTRLANLTRKAGVRSIYA